jgi:hypothetical protein
MPKSGAFFIFETRTRVPFESSQGEVVVTTTQTRVHLQKARINSSLVATNATTLLHAPSVTAP